MAARTLFVDGGGTTRLMRRWPMVDGGGVTRIAKRVFIVDAGGVSRLVFVGDVISISDVTAESEMVNPAAATANYTLAADGDIDRTTGDNNLSDQGDWITPKVNMADYECRATVTSGSLSSGTAGSWLALTSSRSWTKQQVINGTSSCVFTLEIRRASDGEVLDTATITLTATRLPP
jgi:hypothetical protein